MAKPTPEQSPPKSFANPPTFSSEGDDTGGAQGGEVRLDFLAPAEAADEIGRLAHYRVLRPLGKGGMGIVFLAEDTHLERQVALKVMLPQFAKNARSRDRFVREAKAAAKIKHDHVITIFQVGEDRGVPFMAMEYLQGAPLDQYLKSKGDLALGQIVRLGREIALGLQAAHQKGLIHRDIKPGNIWLEAPKGRVKILDFGLARKEADDVHLTQNGAIIGTPAYMSPEQAQGVEVDARCDLFSLGVVLYRLATGDVPFAGKTTMAVLTALATVTPKPVREVNPKIPAEMSRIISRLLEKDPQVRYQSAQEFLADWDRMGKSGNAVTEVNMQMQPAQVSKKRAEQPTPTMRMEAPPEPRKTVRPAPNTKMKGPPWILIGSLGGGILVVLLAIVVVLAMRGGNSPPVPDPGKIVLPNNPDPGNAVNANNPPPKELAKGTGQKPEPVAGKEFTNSLGMKLVRIEPGKFKMGSPLNEPGRGNFEAQREIQITKPFYMGKFEITHDDYEKVFKARVAHYPGLLKTYPDPSRIPVTSISWEDAKGFCARLSALEGRSYTLPTEAEWEYACRAGTETPFHTGDALTPNQANIGSSKLMPVGSFPPNAWGLHDMHGNATEHCEDRWQPANTDGPTKDPQGPQGPAGSRVIRGGHFASKASDCRSAARSSIGQLGSSNANGFRVVLRDVGPAGLPDAPKVEPSPLPKVEKVEPPPGKARFTIKEVMRVVTKGGLAKKFSGGTATAEEKQSMLEHVLALGANTPPKGDMASWKEKTKAIIDAVRAEDGPAVSKAFSCKDCHQAHK